MLETVGAATWSHSVKVAAAGRHDRRLRRDLGDAPAADLTAIFFLQLRVVGSTMGTRDELERLLRLLVDTGVRPVVDQTMPLVGARAGFAAMAQGEAFGKIVFTP